MRQNLAALHYRVALTIGAVLGIAGCGVNPLAPEGPSVDFKSPAGTMAVRDDQTLAITYDVSTDRAVTARLVIDKDDVPGNGNELLIEPDQAFDASGERTATLKAGELPYGTYHLRVTLLDGSAALNFSPTGPLHIVPMLENGSADNQEGVAVLSQVEGKRLLHNNGAAGKVNSRVPFVSTWSTPDVRDNLSPIFVSPIEVNEGMTISAMQFYTYSKHSDPASKSLVLYSGTSPDGTGTPTRSVNVKIGSSSNGGWNLVTIDPPLRLAAGSYGISFHGEEECSENWAANSSGGPGYALMSPVQGQPFAAVSAGDLGFSPNFTMRMIGTLDSEDDGLAFADRALSRIPPPDEPAAVDTFPDNGGKPGKTACDEGEDEIGRASPIHVSWRVVP